MPSESKRGGAPPIPVARIWQCPVCSLKREAPGSVTSLLCKCQQSPAISRPQAMKLIGEPKHRSILHALEKSTKPREYPAPPRDPEPAPDAAMPAAAAPAAAAPETPASAAPAAPASEPPASAPAPSPEASGEAAPPPASA